MIFAAKIRISPQKIIEIIRIEQIKILSETPIFAQKKKRQ